MIIFEGKQRVGKGVMIRPIGKILGDEQYFITSKFSDCFSKHATEWAGKLLVVMNECKASSNEFEGELKSRITDIEASVNPKNKTHYRIEDYGQYLAFTNKEKPIPVDVNSGDGRIVSFRTGEKYINRTRQHWWGPLCKQFNQPDFLAALYDDLNSIDLTKYDFKKGKDKNSYRELQAIG